MAPEVLQNDSGISAKIDVYALGMVLNEVTVGVRPWADVFGLPQLVLATTKGRRPQPCASGPVGELVRDCWNQSPGERPTASEICGRLQALPPPSLMSTSTSTSTSTSIPVGLPPPMQPTPLQELPVNQLPANQVADMMKFTRNSVPAGLQPAMQPEHPHLIRFPSDSIPAGLPSEIQPQL